MLLTQRLAQQRTRSKINQRLGTVSGDDHGPDIEISAEYLPTEGMFGSFDKRFNQFIVQSGVSITPTAAFLLAVFVGLAASGTTFLLLDDILTATLAMAMGMFAVFGYFAFRRGRRRTEIQGQLPDVMDLLARAVRAGESLDQAIGLVGDIADKPLGPEFKRCAKQLEMGLSIDAAMRSVSYRAPLTEMRILSSTLGVQRRAGGSLPITLERLSKVIRDRINYHRQFRATTGAGRISTILIGVAGPLVCAYMLFFQREYFDRFTENYTGQLMFVTAVILQIVGIAWIYSLLKSDY